MKEIEDATDDKTCGNQAGWILGKAWHKNRFARNKMFWQVLGFAFTGISFAFSKKKMCSRKTAVCPRAHPISQHIYIYMCTLYTYMSTSMPRFSSSRFFGPSRCLFPTPRLTSSTPFAVCVCVCVYTHINTRTPPSASKNIIRHRPPMSPSVKNYPTRQATSALHRLAELPHPRPPTPMNKLRIHECTFTLCGGRVSRYVNWCQKAFV